MQYQRNNCAVFKKTKEQHGALSNMSSGMPIRINGQNILTSEALYQALRFTGPRAYHDEHSGFDNQFLLMQKDIIDQKSPMSAKMAAKKYKGQYTRRDWDDVRVPIMNWCVRIKLAYNYNAFSRVLLATGDKLIVEESHKDRFWGAVASKGNPDTLEGDNVLGRLLEKLREEIRTYNDMMRFKYVTPPDIPDFYFFGKPVGAVDLRR